MWHDVLDEGVDGYLLQHLLDLLYDLHKLLEEVACCSCCARRVCSNTGKIWARWSACDQDGNRNVGVQVVQQGVDQLFDVKVVDVSHLYWLEVFVEDIDAFDVCFPADCQCWVNAERAEREAGCADAVEEAEVYKGELLYESTCQVFDSA